MIPIIPFPSWVTFDQWLHLDLSCWLKVRGLFAFSRNDRVMFRGFGATLTSTIPIRVGRYRKGAERGRYAGDMIYKHREHLKLHIWVLDLPEDEIRAIHAELERQHRPPWNVPGGYRRHR